MASPPSSPPRLRCRSVASAHTSVYTTSAKKFENGTLSDFTRYVVVNHGFTVVLTESNGAAAPHGVVAFNNLPSGTYRDGLDTQLILANGGTGAQAHATCNGSTAQLESAAVVAAWQGGLHAAPTPEQPFFNYVPFQTGSAGLDDKPEAWAPALAAAGFDLAELATAAGAKAACEAKGGVYAPADTLTTTSAALSSGRRPRWNARSPALKATSAGQATQIAGLTSEVGALKTQVAGLLLSAAPLKLTLASVKARNGVKLTVVGQPLKAVKLTLSVKQSTALRHKLASTVLGRLTTTTDITGSATVTVRLSVAAARSLKSLKRPLPVAVEAISAGRYATATGKLTS